MKVIPVLNIQQFEQETSLSNFYSNDLRSHLEKNKDHFYKPHRHNFFLCVLFSEGTGIHEIDFKTHKVRRGSVFFLEPGQTHYWKFDKLPKGYIFFHTQDFYELHFSKSKLEQFPFYHSYENTSTLQLKINQLKLLESRFRDINIEYQTDLPYKKQKLSSLLNTAYIDLARCYESIEPRLKKSSHTYIATLRLLEKTIEAYYKTEKSARFYANRLNITPKHLNRITKTTLEKTTTDLITERVLLESKRLMVHSNTSLSEISEVLGYKDYAYFSRVFKLKTNCTPLEFKRNYI